MRELPCPAAGHPSARIFRSRIQGGTIDRTLGKCGTGTEYSVEREPSKPPSPATSPYERAPHPEIHLKFHHFNPLSKN